MSAEKKSGQHQTQQTRLVLKTQDGSLHYKTGSSTSKGEGGGLCRLDHFWVLYLMYTELFLSFKKTPHLSKLIKAFNVYNWSEDQIWSKILVVFFLIFWMFSSLHKKGHSGKVPLSMCCITNDQVWIESIHHLVLNPCQSGHPDC